MVEDNNTENDSTKVYANKVYANKVAMDIEVPDTAHQISSDSWLQVAFVLTTGVNSAYVLGYSGSIMVPLGWVGGVVGLLFATAVSLYANSLIAKLHEHGGVRHIRYRDLAGKRAYSLTWAMQYVNLFMINTGYIILAGSALKATIRQPVVKNMMKALYFQFSVGLVPFFLVVFTGYWAYGSSTGTYLLNNVTGPVWVKGIANIAAFLQAVIALHIFASPMYEYLDTKFGIKGSSLKIKNLIFRIGVRGGYLAFNTLVAALLPFLGDFMSLTGAISTFPLTFILANHMYLMAKGDRLASSQKLSHWFHIVFFSIVSLAATVAAIRLIVVDSRTYHLFADV
ncbi:hypothetical protein TanjilG_21341 [Lupinus angustifolius]|uniref:Amino acid transporter transmembrane domain-containing protein n=1 Tax=Lupinus angustifolius TaxID=3871 RepID=A0A4P1RMV2_LUPAN|nr:hypothetical protein TanjilG_21341 [Lupinus angustifolius]